MRSNFLLALGAAFAVACGTAHAQQDKPKKTPAKTPEKTAPATTPAAPPTAEGEVATEPVPPDVIASAVAAVAKLGEEVVLGHYQVAVDRMYPMWKERTAQSLGGMDALNKRLAGVTAQMVQQGISMISFKPQGQPRVYEVSPGGAPVREGGAEVQKLVYTKWLVLVPTITRFRIFPPNKENPRSVVIDSTSYQVAISGKGKNDWTFIDGAGLNTSDLRAMFSTLPKDMELPPVEKHESR